MRNIIHYSNYNKFCALLRAGYACFMTCTVLTCCCHSTKSSSKIPEDITSTILTTEQVPVIKVDTPSANAAREDSILIPAFEVEVELSPKAKEKIVSSGEKLIVLFEVNSSEDILPETGELLNIIEERREIAYGELAVFKNLKIPRKEIEKLKKQEKYGILQIYTARKVFANNLLDINYIYIENVLDTTNKRFVINAKLIFDDN
ncbi:MAG: hypothetical protein LBK03_01785 [Bacteroidales bacterium]|nr:hypothetical protein [Bacteroidales bacterium]